MNRLTEKQIAKMSKTFFDYIGASNAATGATLDSNANVTNKNIATVEKVLSDDFNIQLNRHILKDRIEDTFDKELSEQYIEDLESHLIYTHDETSLKPYCVSISLYPFLIDGLISLGGDSKAPKNIHSFIGGFLNLMFMISSQFAGAVATTEFLMYFDYFARKEWGDDYIYEKEREVSQLFQQVVYTINQPASARGMQSIFWNISTFDKEFFDGLFGEFIFPDFSEPKWSTLSKLQEFWHEWFRKERQASLLTFPVVTHSAIVEDVNEPTGRWKDTESRNFVADEMSKGGEFFIYTSDSADSLASCCRLKNELQENTFSFSLGAGGVMTGSKNVITINVNRAAQINEPVLDVLSRVHKYQVAYNDHLKGLYDSDMLDVYKANYITLDKQFLTIGLNGVLESAEFYGIEISNNDGYKKYLSNLFGTIKKANKEAGSRYGVMFNTEIVPAEGLGTKNPIWDRADGLAVNRDTYNSYFYKVEGDDSVFDKMELHGGDIVKSLDGGSALHFNNDERLTKRQYRDLLDSLAKTGCNYFAENVPKTICNTCGYIHANHLDYCVECGSNDIDYATRVIGYLKRVKNFSELRQAEAGVRTYERL